MNIFAQKLLALGFFVIGMAIWIPLSHWLIYDLAPDWMLDLFFFFIFPAMFVYTVVTIYRHRKAGKHL